MALARNSEARSELVRSAPALAGEDEDGISQDNQFPPEYDELLAFFLSYLDPLIEAHRELHEAILREGIENEKVKDLALRSISEESLYRSFAYAAGPMGYSPAQRPSFYQLTTSIHNCEFVYKECIKDAESLASSLGLDLKSDERLRPLWENWRLKHNALIAEYELIKRDQRFGILFRPRRESKWGGPIPPRPNP